MKLVADLIAKEVHVKAANLAKQEALKKRIKERQAQLGFGADDEAKGEVDDLQAKLTKLELPEETKEICAREIKKLRQLGPRN